MRHILLFLLSLSFSITANANPVKVKRIEPSNWYVGMKDPTLQLMVYGENIRETDVTTDYPGVRIDSVERLDSPNYLLVYLNIEGAAPGTMKLKFTAREGQKVSDKSLMSYDYFSRGITEEVKGSQTVSFVLKEREMSGDKRVGFSNADVLYMLMPDRFAEGRPLNAKKGKKASLDLKGLNHYVVDRSQPSLRHGGNLEGIRQHLDYFNELGVTALWLTPVLENNAPDNAAGYSTYHGYATTDYYRVDPRFGSNDDYRQLIDEAHQKGLKVVMDMIFNHCGFNHPWVQDVPAKDWFNSIDAIAEADMSERIEHSSKTGKAEDSRMGTGDFDDAYVGKAKTFLQTSYKLTPARDPYASEVDKQETVEGWFVPTMPDLNHHNPHVIKYLIQNSIWWIETVGIDGIRMDTYPYAFGDAMAQWMKTLNTEYPHFNVVGETWVTEPAYTASWQKDFKSQQPMPNTYLPCVMDFSFFEKLSQAKNEETDPWWNGLNRIYNSFVYDYLYENPDNVMAFIDNHDTDRFLGNGCDTLMLKQALAMLLTVKRTPQIYYGTEILMNGTKEVTDGNVRKDFPGGFPGDTRNAFTAEGRTQAENSMFNWLSRLLHWRKGNDIITRGTMKQFIPYKGVYVISRQLGEHGVIVLLNGTSEGQAVNTLRYSELYKRKDKKSDYENMRLEPIEDKRREFAREMTQYKVDKDGRRQEILFSYGVYHPRILETTDVITGEKVKFGGTMYLKPRQTLILEY